MPESARILAFPSRAEKASLSAEDTLAAAREYVRELIAEPSSKPAPTVLDHPETTLALLTLFKDLIEKAPSEVGAASADLYGHLQRSAKGIGLFDEKDYILGELARYCAWAHRLCGNFDEAERWLDRADAGYRHTLNPGPLLANISYARLAIRYERRQHAHVLDLAPSLIASFEKLGMTAEAYKARFLRSVTLKAAGQEAEAFEEYCQLRDDLRNGSDRSLLGQVMVHIGEIHGGRGRFEEALQSYRQALSVLGAGGRPIVLAELKWNIGSTYRALGSLNVAVKAYREARADYQSLGMSVFAALVGLSIADTLLTMSRPREAEWEILAAMPAIEEAKLGSEIQAATALLGESVRQKKTDPKALSELRELLSKAS